MEEDEIESWYEEEKQKCLDIYINDLEEGKNHDQSEKKYEEKFGKVIAKYNKLMAENIKSKNKKKYSKTQNSQD